MGGWAGCRGSGSDFGQSPQSVHVAWTKNVVDHAVQRTCTHDTRLGQQIHLPQLVRISVENASVLQQWLQRRPCHHRTASTTNAYPEQ